VQQNQQKGQTTVETKASKGEGDPTTNAESPLEETGGCYSRGRLSLARCGGGASRHGCNIQQDVLVPPIGEIFLHVKRVLGVPGYCRNSKMESLHIGMICQFIHLPIDRTTTPTENFDIGPTLPSFFSMSTYFAKIYEFCPVSNAI